MNPPHEQTPKRQSPGAGYPPGGPRGPAASDFDAVLGKINLAEPAADMFDTTAKRIAETLAPQDRDRRGSNKSTQIRRFYDEVTRYADRTQGMEPEKFARILPFIRMINARVAYAAQRKGESGNLVDENFQKFMRRGLDQVNSVATLQMFRFLFEAVIGFSPKDSSR